MCKKALSSGAGVGEKILGAGAAPKHAGFETLTSSSTCNDRDVVLRPLLPWQYSPAEILPSYKGYERFVNVIIVMLDY